MPETSRTHLVSRLAGDVLVAADGRAVSQADLQWVCTRYIHGTEEPFNEADETDANLTSEVLKGLIDVGLLRSVE